MYACVVCVCVCKRAPACVCTVSTCRCKCRYVRGSDTMCMSANKSVCACGPRAMHVHMWRHCTVWHVPTSSAVLRSWEDSPLSLLATILRE